LKRTNAAIEREHDRADCERPRARGSHS
jgi:hypothetical protein